MVEKKSFWTTLPGILTGIAAVITASTGLYLALFSEQPETIPSNSPAQLAVRVAESTYRAPESVYAQQLESARKAFEGSLALFNVGMASLSDVITAHRQYVKVEIASITDSQSQIPIFINALNTAKELESGVSMSIKVGELGSSQLSVATQYRIETEIELAKAQSATRK